MAKNIYRVMISSTTKDLPDHRQQIKDAILRCQMYPLDMHLSGAVAGSDAISFSLNLVDEADIYVGIFGYRYGFRPNDPRNPDKISVTEMEYRRAIERGIPILIFIMSENHPVLPRDKDNGDDLTQIERLRAELGLKHIVAFFDSPEEMRYKAIQSLESVRDVLDEHDNKKKLP